MDLKFKPIYVNFNEIELLKGKETDIEISCGGSWSDQRKSNRFILAIDTKDENLDSWIHIELNKNQANYLAKHLTAFFQEKDIDPKSDD